MLHLFIKRDKFVLFGLEMVPIKEKFICEVLWKKIDIFNGFIFVNVSRWKETESKFEDIQFLAIKGKGGKVNDVETWCYVRCVVVMGNWKFGWGVLGWICESKVLCFVYVWSCAIGGIVMKELYACGCTWSAGGTWAKVVRVISAETALWLEDIWGKLWTWA